LTENLKWYRFMFQNIALSVGHLQAETLEDATKIIEEELNHLPMFKLLHIEEGQLEDQHVASNNNNKVLN